VPGAFPRYARPGYYRTAAASSPRFDITVPTHGWTSHRTTPVGAIHESPLQPAGAAPAQAHTRSCPGLNRRLPTRPRVVGRFGPFLCRGGKPAIMAVSTAGSGLWGGGSQ
jgi:hypothetical protein